MTIDRFHSPQLDSHQLDSKKPCRVVIFTSPKAGSGASREQIPRLEQMLRRSDIDCRVVHEVDELKKLGRGESNDDSNDNGDSDSDRETIVVAAGGDGTLTLAAASLFLSSDTLASRTSIVPMPLGTENLLACHYGQEALAESVLETIRRGSRLLLDVGLANGRPFLIVASCGFDAEVARRLHLTRRGHIRRMSYLRPILGAARKYTFPTLSIRVDEQEPIEGCWAMVFNLPRYGGGLNIEPDAIGDDGLLDVIVFKRGSILSGLRYAVKIWRGSHLKSGEVVRTRGKRVEIHSDGRVPIELDGDYTGRLPLEISTIPACVPLLVPPV